MKTMINKGSDLLGSLAKYDDATKTYAEIYLTKQNKYIYQFKVTNRLNDELVSMKVEVYDELRYLVGGLGISEFNLQLFDNCKIDIKDAVDIYFIRD